MGTVKKRKQKKQKKKRRKKLPKKQAIRNNEYYQMEETFERLYKESKEGEIFYSLVELILTEDNIRLAYRNLKSNKGSKTPGTDKRTIKDLDQLSDEELIRIVREKFDEYYPNPVKRVEIPKPGTDKTRPLGIPCIEDRLIQQCIKQILEPILEAHFYTQSYGFRPDRSVENAMHRVYQLVNQVGLHYVVDIDIKGFFDNVNHNKLKKQLWTLGIRDRKLLSVINAMLKAPIQLPDEMLIFPEKGTPQGGIISPLLANVVLNELDWWIASQWELFPAVCRQGKNKGKEYSSKGSKIRALKKSGLKEMYIVRYADDFKIFTRTREEAEKIKTAVEQWLKERLGLETSPEKSGITNLRKKNSEFLGFRFKARKKGHKMVICSHMNAKAKKKAKENIREQVGRIKRAGNKEEWVQEINKFNSLVMGIHNYYEIATEITQDLIEINRDTRATIYNKLLKNRKDCKTGSLDVNDPIYKRYGKSKQLRFLGKQPLVPVGFGQTKIPRTREEDFSRFTPEGRNEIHTSLLLDMSEIFKLMEKGVQPGESIELVNNRIARFAGQYGRDPILGIKLTHNNLHTHHIIPIEIGGRDDSYNNIILVLPEIHRLIHARKVETIKKYLPILGYNQERLNKLNKYRDLAGNFMIENFEVA